MKLPTKMLLASLLVALCSGVAAAQFPAPTPEWVKLAPAGEDFTARMPQAPAPQTQQLQIGKTPVTGKLYAFSDGEGTTYRIWSLTNPQFKRPDYPLLSDYLDLCDELALNLIVEPERSAFEKRRRELQEGEWYGMQYVQEVERAYGSLIRQYDLGLGFKRGSVYVVSDGSRGFIVAAHGPEKDKLKQMTFFSEFTARLSEHNAFVVLPGSRTATRGGLAETETGQGEGRYKGLGTRPGTGGGIGSGTGPGVGSGVGPGLGTGTGAKPPEGFGGGGPGTGGGTRASDDPNHVFTTRDVTQKAIITMKPEPTFTEIARKLGVTGMVRLRAVLHSSGVVSQVVVVRSLPHGLTQTAIKAARSIQFKPAQKDGRPVSQWVTLEYNFNIY